MVNMSIDPKNNQVYGIFSSDKEYLDDVRLLISSSKETQNRISFVEKEILPNIKKECLLDVGVGNGELTKVFCNQFSELHLLDPSKAALDKINQEIYPTKTIKKINLSFDEYEVNEPIYDFICLSHTLYHFPRDDWEALIKKTFRYLKKGGMYFIVLGDGLGRSEITRHFGATGTFYVEDLIDYCSQMNGAKVKTAVSHEIMATSRIEDMMRIIGVCLHDEGITVPQYDLKKYLNNFKQENQYIVDFNQYFISIYKK